MEVLVVSVCELTDVGVRVVLGDLRADVLVGFLVKALTARNDRAVVHICTTRVLGLGDLP